MLSLYRRYLDAKEKIKGLMKDDEGQTIVEYVLLIVLIALVVFATQPSITTAITNAFTRISGFIGGTIS